MMARATAWRTDEPCPTCGNGLTVTDDGGPVLRAECRLCGHVDAWDITTEAVADGDW